MPGATTGEDVATGRHDKSSCWTVTPFLMLGKTYTERGRAYGVEKACAVCRTAMGGRATTLCQ